jgi:hypothetical protein
MIPAAFAKPICFIVFAGSKFDTFIDKYLAAGGHQIFNKIN